ncbi:Insulin-like growth factor-binding protein complex acid labile subunit [Dirofilaria immitis]
MIIITISRVIVLLLFFINCILTLCPQNCSCDNEYQLAVNCNNVKLRYLPSLLHPGTQFLRLSKCQIEQLDPDVMELYPDMIHLDLSNNNISTLGNNIFRYQTKVQFLNLSNNNFSSIFDNSFQGLHRLEYLDLSSNKLQTIESNALRHLSELLELDLSNNLLQNLSFATFTDLANLQKLIVAGNQIAYLDGRIIKSLPNLRIIDLNQNIITTIGTDTFIGLYLITAIDLSANFLTKIPNFGLPSLKYLNISSNKIKQIESNNFRQLISLVELNLAKNEFSILPTSAFDGLFRLQQLHLNDQWYLRRIENGAFSGLASLEVLNLSHSHILEYIDKDAFEVSQALRVFDVSSCSLKTFPSTLFDWKRVAELYLYDNPLHCDHKLLTFLPNVLRLRSIHNVICVTPDEFHNISISSLDTVEIMLEDTKQTLIILCSTLTGLTAIIILMLFLYSRITYDQIKNSRSSTVKQQFCQPDRREECILPEYYDSIIEFNTSSTFRRHNTFINLLQSKSFYDGIPIQTPINTAHINDNILLEQTDYTYLTIK